MACEFGSFSIFTENKNQYELIERIAAKIGVERQLLSIKPMCLNAANARATLLRGIEKALQEGAAVAILDKVDALELVSSIRHKLKMPILHPLFIAVKMAEAFHSLGLSHSKLAYPKPILPDYHVERLKKLKDISERNFFLYTN